MVDPVSSTMIGGIVLLVINEIAKGFRKYFLKSDCHIVVSENKNNPSE